MCNKTSKVDILLYISTGFIVGIIFMSAIQEYQNWKANNSLYEIETNGQKWQTKKPPTLKNSDKLKVDTTFIFEDLKGEQIEVSGFSIRRIQ